MGAPESRNQRQLPAWMQRRERGNTFWLSIMTWLSLQLGRACSRVVLYGIALYFAVFARDAGGASQAYLTRCLGRPAGWLDRYRHVLAFASTVHDRIYLLNDQFERFDISHVGAEQLHAEYDAGQGILMFGAHLGSFEVLRALARKNPRLSMSMAMYPENARQINQALAAINPRAVPDIIALGTLDAMLAVHRKLDEGALVVALTTATTRKLRWTRRHTSLWRPRWSTPARTYSSCPWCSTRSKPTPDQAPHRCLPMPATAARR